MCQDKSACILMSQKCDGKQDCKFDWSDEFLCSKSIVLFLLNVVVHVVFIAAALVVVLIVVVDILALKQVVDILALLLIYLLTIPE